MDQWEMLMNVFSPKESNPESVMAWYHFHNYAYHIHWYGNVMILKNRIFTDCTGSWHQNDLICTTFNATNDKNI